MQLLYLFCTLAVVVVVVAHPAVSNPKQIINPNDLAEIPMQAGMPLHTTVLMAQAQAQATAVPKHGSAELKL